MLTQSRALISLAKLSAETNDFVEQIKSLCNNAYSNVGKECIANPLNGSQALSDEFTFSLTKTDFLSQVDKISFLQSRIMENCAAMRQIISTLSNTTFTEQQAADLYDSIHS